MPDGTERRPGTEVDAGLRRSIDLEFPASGTLRQHQLAIDENPQRCDGITFGDHRARAEDLDVTGVTQLRQLLVRQRLEQEQCLQFLWSALLQVTTDVSHVDTLSPAGPESRTLLVAREDRSSRVPHRWPRRPVPPVTELLTPPELRLE